MPDPITRLNKALEGRYSIERELGEGGMATVYLAEDLKHERHVALKVLKQELAAVVGAERFLAEIKTTANLQHPHILPLHDSGEADGFLYYVMPYIEGETLRDRIDREKQLPVDEAVGIATAVANALQTAHEQGIIHRDIKPANILLSRGEPLVADFGIAIAVGAAGGSRLTETGLSVGTPFYMSPEQATGDQVVGPASDTYALACVLYEMLTGDPPYIGSTAQAVLGKIIQGAPVSATEIRSAVPANVDAAIRKALEKLPADRFRGAQDFAKALADPGFQHGPELAVSGVHARSALTWKVATLVFALLAGALGMWGIANVSGDPAGVSRHRVVLFDWEALAAGNALSGSVRHGVGIAPDGSALALRDIESDRILLKERQALEPLSIAGTDGGFGPAFSPDGEWIAFFSDNSVKKVPRRGGSPIVLAEDIAVREQQLAWLDDGRILFNSLGWHLDAVSEDGGEVERLIDITDTGRFVSGVTPLPGSPGVLITSCDNSCPNPEVRVLDFRTGEERTLIAGATGAWYLRSGHLLFVREEGTVFFVPFDLDRLELAGAEAPILESIATTPRRADLVATWDGIVVYLPGLGAPVGGGSEPVWVDFEGNATPVEEGWRPIIGNVTLSPDDRYLAFSEGATATEEIRVKELPEGPITALTTNSTRDLRPRWTVDGQSVIFQTGGDYNVRRADASSAASTYLDLDVGVNQVELSADGRWMIYRVGDANSNLADLWVVDLQGDSTGRPLLEADFNEKAATLSPNGRWLAYISGESNPQQVVVRPFPDVEDAQYQISIDGGGPPHWAPDGLALYYREVDTGRMMEARLELEPNFRVTDRRELFSAVGYLSSVDHWRYDLSSDGSRFLMLRQDGEALAEDLMTGPRAHVLVENLLAEIEGRAPGR